MVLQAGLEYRPETFGLVRVALNPVLRLCSSLTGRKGYIKHSQVADSVITLTIATKWLA